VRFFVKESDFADMPTLLLFPNLNHFCDKLCCYGNRETPQQKFYKTELPSMKKHKWQEDKLDQFFKKKGIKIKDKIIEDSEELNIARHKAHERLGFGYLAMFRTMRFLLLIMLVMGILMLPIGILIYNSKEVPSPLGYNIFDELSIADAYYSMPVCIQ
jgi:hypothetical protein